jgi:hypothetical protein
VRYVYSPSAPLRINSVQGPVHTSAMPVGDGPIATPQGAPSRQASAFSGRFRLPQISDYR